MVSAQLSVVSFKESEIIFELEDSVSVWGGGAAELSSGWVSC